MSTDVEVLLKQRAPPPGRISFEEFLEWCDDETRAEWVDGRIILLEVTVLERHAAIVRFLYWLLTHVSRLGELGAVYGEPFLLYLPALRRGRTPDLFFVSPANLARVRPYFVEGLADIVVEVISPGSRRRDRVQKLAEYERAGVREYWLIDAENLRAEMRRLGPGGRYEIVFAGESGEYRSEALPGLLLRAEWLWQEPGPNMDEVLAALGSR